jgi:hypothetical protein
MRMSMGGLRSLLKILEAARVAEIFIFSTPLLIPEIKKITRCVEKNLKYFTNTHTIGSYLLFLKK